MATAALKASNAGTASLVRQRIESGGERFWRHQDFASLPFSAVAQTLSRLHRSGKLQRIGKGVYFRPRETAFGTSRPNPALLRKLATTKSKLFPAGLSAANLLGFTTQNPAKAEIATTTRTVPRLLQSETTNVHTRRPAAWESLSEADGAALEMLRTRGELSELSPTETAERMLTLLREDGRYVRLVAVALTEPPRVRAMLGAFGEALGASSTALKSLRATLNPLSRFDFGKFAELAAAARWQAKERSSRAPG